MTRARGVDTKAFFPTSFDPADVESGRRTGDDLSMEEERRIAARDAILDDYIPSCE